MLFQKSSLLLFALLFSVSLKSQTVSTFYGMHDVNVNSRSTVDINKSVDVSGEVNVTKTIRNIDYGALAQANAMQEQNRLEALKFANEQERLALIQMAEDPSKAFDFGRDNMASVPKEIRKKYGYDKDFKYFYHKIPHSSLFTASGGYNYENLSVDGVKTQIIVFIPATAEKHLEQNPAWISDVETRMKFPEITVGAFNEMPSGNKAFVHAVDTKRARVGGVDGYRGTMIWEDDYEKCITDNYQSVMYRDGKYYHYWVKVRYKGDKEVVTFEQLEGRRYYFRGLVDKMASTHCLRRN